MVKQRILAIFIFSLCLGIFPLFAADNPVKELKNITIDTVKKEIRIQCKLAIDKGILEWFLVDQKGQTYESVFKMTENKPSELHFGLLLLGFNPVAYNEYAALLNNSEAVKILKEKNSLLQLEIRQKDKVIALDQLLKNREAAKKEPLYWVFTGSFFTDKNVYAADQSQIFISIWPETTSVISLLSNAGNPYRGNNGFEIADKHGFTLEDEFTLIIKGAK